MSGFFRSESVDDLVRNNQTENNQSKLWFIILFLILVGSNLGYVYGTLLPVFIHRVKPEDGAIYFGYISNFILIVLQTVSGAVGIYILLNKGQKNPFLSLSILITCVEYVVAGLKFTPLFLQVGFTFKVYQVGYGINFIGVFLWVWYTQLRWEEIHQNNHISVENEADHPTLPGSDVEEGG